MSGTNISSSYPPGINSSAYQTFMTYYAPAIEQSSNREAARRLVATARAFFRNLSPRPQPVPCLIPQEVNTFLSIDDIVHQFQALKVDIAAPCHCSGDAAIKQFQNAFQDRFYKIGTGTTLTL